MREITALWQTDELRRRKPTPVDEARGGLHIVEQSLWTAIPHFLRKVSHALKHHTGRELPISATPIVFGSWMGGDRDGNPNVTAKVTRDVAAISSWMAIDLYLREVDLLRFELSMNHANDEVWRMARRISREAGQDLHPPNPEVGGGALPTPAATLRHIRLHRGDEGGHMHLVMDANNLEVCVSHNVGCCCCYCMHTCSLSTCGYWVCVHVLISQISPYCDRPQWRHPT